MIHKPAQIISIILHPLFHFILLFIYLLHFSDLIILYESTFKKPEAIIYIFLYTVVIPFLISRHFRYNRDYREISLKAMLILIYLMLVFLLRKFSINPLVIQYLLSVIVFTAINMAISFRYKISLHSGFFGLLTFFFLKLFLSNPSFYFVAFCLVLILSGLALSAQIILNENEDVRIYAGYLTGFLTSSIVFLF